MFSFLSPRMLIFYTTLIGVVVALFSITTAYGEVNLKAQEPISGRYAIAQSDLPSCLQSQLSDPAVLAIQQSGRYVTAALFSNRASAQERKTAEQRPALRGRWRDRQLTLMGTVTGCPQALHLDSRWQPGQSPGSGQIQGILQMGEQSWPLRAQRLPPETTPGPGH